MKYVIVMEQGCELPIIFPDIINHDAFRHMKVVSAGFVSIYGSDQPLQGASCAENALRAYAYGKSTSLNIAARSQDTEIITRELMRHYN